MTFDRCSGERQTPLEELRRGARMIVSDGTLFGVEGTRLARVPVSPDSALFLGRDDGESLFLGTGTVETMLDFRAAARVLEPDEVGLLSYAQGMVTWAARTRFCSVCATELVPRSAGYSRACPDCGAEFFPRLDPAVMILATHRGRLLLARHHGRGSAFWSILAGFVEPGETLEQTVARELYEETGLVAVAGTIRYFGSQPWPLPASLMIGFELEAESDALNIDPNELLEARWFENDDVEALTTSSTVSLSGQMIAAWRSR
jgi:NAD+ diphosphatase